MTQKELIARARKVVQDMVTNPGAGLSLEMLPKVRVVDAVVIYFESDEHAGKVDVILEKKSGKFIAGGFVRPKASKGKRK